MYLPLVLHREDQATSNEQNGFEDTLRPSANGSPGLCENSHGGGHTETSVSPDLRLSRRISSRCYAWHPYSRSILFR